MDGSDPASFMKLSQLQELSSGKCPSKLEAGIQTGCRILSRIKNAFLLAETVPEIAEWVESCDKLQAQAALQPTVVGVVGSTGAGKSSIINAVLDDCLVPTNCMRACTAVITEIAYNKSDREDERYRAEVHFISKDDWAKELRVMLADIADGQDALGANYTSSESEAGVAYHKIRAVYPFLGSEKVKGGKFDIDELTSDPSVKDLFGTVKRFASSNCKDFQEHLKQFIDSREKTRGGKKELSHMEYWPLITVVNIFVRSPILESGLVLVDLPGLHDSNAARSAIASKYIERCSGLWVVTPITRAVDDKIAQNLLGDNFKRQMQFDGTYSSITVICSKTDDISVTEVLEVLPEDAEATKLHARTGILESERDNLQEKIDTSKRRLSEASCEISQFLRDSARLQSAIDESGNEDDLIFFSTRVSRKRPIREAASQAKKRMRFQFDDDSEESGSGECEEPAVSEDEPKKEYISHREARQQLQEIESHLQQLRSECDEMSQLIPSAKKELKEAKTELKSLMSETKRACIQYRNDYSRGDVQGQFAAGIRELDQENAAQDEDNFDPDEVCRDYGDVVKRLPVFCVSSKAYQKMCGRLEKDERVTGFTRLEDTEILDLQRHASGIVQDTRAATGHRFFHDLSRFLTSLHLQVAQSDQPSKLAGNMRRRELEALAAAICDLRLELNSAIQKSFTQYRETLQWHIYRRLKLAAKDASKAAIPTVNSWICHKDHGGLICITFRAVCVRDGVFKGSKRTKPVDFNKDLVNPMTKRVARAWELVFSRLLPRNLDRLATALTKQLESFRLQMASRPELKKAPSFALATRQVENLERRVNNAAKLKTLVKKGQKEANRLFVPAIAAEMASAYTQCAEERGRGCFKRIKVLVREHVESVRGTMFKKASQNVEYALKGTTDRLELTMTSEVAEIVRQINNDYSALLADRKIVGGLSSSLGEVRDLLSQVDEQFEQVVRPIKHQDEAAVDIDCKASAATLSHGTSPRASNPGCGTPVPASAD